MLLRLGALVTWLGLPAMGVYGALGCHVVSWLRALISWQPRVTCTPTKGNLDQLTCVPSHRSTTWSRAPPALAIQCDWDLIPNLKSCLLLCMCHDRRHDSWDLGSNAIMPLIEHLLVILMHCLLFTIVWFLDRNSSELDRVIDQIYSFIFLLYYPNFRCPVTWWTSHPQGWYIDSLYTAWGVWTCLHHGLATAGSRKDRAKHAPPLPCILHLQIHSRPEICHWDHSGLILSNCSRACWKPRAQNRFGGMDPEQSNGELWDLESICRWPDILTITPFLIGTNHCCGRDMPLGGQEWGPQRPECWKCD